MTNEELAEQARRAAALALAEEDMMQVVEWAAMIVKQVRKMAPGDDRRAGGIDSIAEAIDCCDKARDGYDEAAIYAAVLA